VQILQTLVLMEHLVLMAIPKELLTAYLHFLSLLMVVVA